MKEKKKLWIACIAGGVVFVALIAVFFVSSKEFYMGRFSSSAMVSNTVVDAMTVEEALDSMNRSEGFSIVLQKDDISYNVDISEAVTRVFDSEKVARSKEQISFMDYLFHREVVVSLKPDSAEIDQEKLQVAIQSAIPETKVYTSDASFDEDLNLVKEVQGDDVNYSDLYKKVAEDITEGNELEYNLSDYYNHPQVTSSDASIVELNKEIEGYKNMSITFTFGDEKEEITSEKICSKLSYTKGKLVLQKKWITAFVEKMAKKYNTYGKTRKFKSTKDGTVTIHGGIMGWWINETETVNKIKKLLKKQKTATLEPIYRNIAAQHGKDDVGDTYVEISLSRQHLWFYKNGKKIMESDIVTGLPTKERETVKGVHRIYGKQKDRYLGTIAVQGYRSHVNYWMPFNWSGQGLHDATWRSSFGGKLYRSGGSHGCVNLPLSFAGKLYDVVSIGTPVVVY